MNKKIHSIILSMLIIAIIAISISIIIIKKASSTNVELTTNDKITENEIDNNTNETESNEEKSRFDGLTLTSEDIGVPVLYYHSINPSEDNELILSPDRLRAQLQYILDAGYTPLTISEMYGYLTNSMPIPKKSILITFDDGYMDNYVYAYPILKELGIKATIFLMTVGVDEGFYISSDNMKEMSDNGIDIQCHTVTHPHLSTLSYDEQLKEITESRDFIKNVTGKDVIAFAYPYGDYNDDTLQIVKDAGFSFAFTIKNGKSDREDGLYTLDRIYVNSLETMDQFISNLENAQK